MYKNQRDWLLQVREIKISHPKYISLAYFELDIQRNCRPLQTQGLLCKTVFLSEEIYIYLQQETMMHAGTFPCDAPSLIWLGKIFAWEEQVGSQMAEPKESDLVALIWKITPVYLENPWCCATPQFHILHQLPAFPPGPGQSAIP